MNIPSLPTDNIYKFIALSGLLLVLLSVLFPYQRNQELAIEINDLAGRDTVLHVEIRGLRSHLDYVKSLIKERGLPTIELERKTSELESSVLQLEVKDQELRNQTNKMSLLTSQMREQSIYYRIGLLFGIILTIIGFFLWYYRVQRYQDKILRSNPSRRPNQALPPKGEAQRVFNKLTE